jgi:hypothetical protein
MLEFVYEFWRCCILYGLVGINDNDHEGEKEQRGAQLHTAAKMHVKGISHYIS